MLSALCFLGGTKNACSCQDDLFLVKWGKFFNSEVFYLNPQSAIDDPQLKRVGDLDD
jgi:hypothetical protein